MERSNKYDAGDGQQDFGPAEFSDEGLANAGPGHLRWPRVAGVVAIAAVAVTVGVLAATNLGSLNSAPAASETGGVVAPIASGPITATPTPVVTPLVSAPVPPTADPTPPAPVPPAEQWRTFTSPGGKVTFEYPAAWSTASPQGGGGDSAVDVDVSDEAGIVVASLHLGPAGGFGGACQGAVPYTVLDTAEVDLPYQPSKGSVTPRFAFRALQESDRVTGSYGLTSTPAGQGGTTCMFYNMVNGPAETPTYTFADAFQVRAGDPEEIPGRKGAKAFPSMDAARAYMGTSEYLNAKRMISSLKISAG